MNNPSNEIKKTIPFIIPSKTNKIQLTLEQHNTGLNCAGSTYTRIFSINVYYCNYYYNYYMSYNKHVIMSI